MYKYRKIIFVIMISLLVSTSLGFAESSEDSELQKLASVMSLIETSHYEHVNRSTIIEGAIKGALHEVDPHSAYFSAKDLKKMNEEFAGSFSGIGIQIGMKNNQLTVIAPIEDTPAAKAGLLAGDSIIEVDGKLTFEMSLNDAVDKIRGPKGEAVVLTIVRKGDSNPRKIKIIRADIPLISVKTMDLDPGFLYIRITDFKATTTTELHEALAKYRKNNTIKGVILDLRNNPGGYLDQAISVADTFMQKGLIVYTQGRDADSREDSYATKQSTDVLAPMVVLINPGSASASEIVAGALQDSKRAVLIGEKSFGKGSVQKMFQFSDGSGAKVTIALYYTPSGRSIQAEGIIPDLVQPFVAGNETNSTVESIIFREADYAKHLDNPNENGTKNKTVKKVVLPAKTLERLSQDNQLRLGYKILQLMPAIQKLHD